MYETTAEGTLENVHYQWYPSRYVLSPEAWACLDLSHPSYSRGLPLQKIGISHKKVPFHRSNETFPWPERPHERRWDANDLISTAGLSDVSLVPSLLPLGIVQLCGTARAKSVIPQRREMAPGYTVYFRDDRGDPWGCNRNEWLSCGDASYACPPTIPRWN